MSQKAPKEEMPALIAELANRTANLVHIEVMEKYIWRVEITGAEAVELAKSINWLHNVAIGERKRCEELKALLPDKDTEIDLTKPADPEKPAEGADQAKPAVAQGGVELSKGSEVLQTA